MSKRVPFILICIVLVIVAVGFIIYYIQASGTIKERDDLISQLQEQTSSLESDLTLANDQISSLESDLTSADDQISSLESNLILVNDQISTLESDLTSATTQNTQLENQIEELRSERNDFILIAILAKSTTEANAATINQSAGQSSLVVGFEANYAGYLEITGTSNTTNGYIQVTDTFHDYPYNDYEYDFSFGNTLRIPILPGTVRVYFGNKNAINTATATITVKYIY